MYRYMQLQTQIIVTILIHNTLFYLNGKLAPPLKQLYFLSYVMNLSYFSALPFPSLHFTSLHLTQSNQFLCIKSSLTQHFFIWITYMLVSSTGLMQWRHDRHCLWTCHTKSANDVMSHQSLYCSHSHGTHHIHPLASAHGVNCHSYVTNINACDKRGLQLAGTGQIRLSTAEPLQ